MLGSRLQDPSQVGSILCWCGGRKMRGRSDCCQNFIKTCPSELSFAQHFSSLYLHKNSIFSIKSASLHKISLSAVNDVLFYLFELHIFPSPTYNSAIRPTYLIRDLIALNTIQPSFKLL